MLFGTNWYDLVVLVALLYGVWCGVRTGLTGEVIRVVGLMLMVAAAVGFYAPAGQWLREESGLTGEAANLVAFVSIAIGVYFLSIIARKLARRWTSKYRFAATVENIGGGLAGALRMLAVMAFLTVFLCLTRSTVWHRHVGVESRFGSFVVGQLPEVAAMVEKSFPDKLWFLDELKRRPEPAIDERISKKP